MSLAGNGPPETNKTARYSRPPEYNESSFTIAAREDHREYTPLRPRWGQTRKTWPKSPCAQATSCSSRCPETPARSLKSFSILRGKSSRSAGGWRITFITTPNIITKKSCARSRKASTSTPPAGPPAKTPDFSSLRRARLATRRRLAGRESTFIAYKRYASAVRRGCFPCPNWRRREIF